MSNCILDYMRGHGIALTTENFVRLNWGGTISDLEGESLIEVLDLVEAGILTNAAPGSEEIQ
jgi:hypothetical protein